MIELSRGVFFVRSQSPFVRSQSSPRDCDGANLAILLVLKFNLSLTLPVFGIIKINEKSKIKFLSPEE